ncbi:MAG: alpha-1,2-fucosyltransferase, partial [Bacteroidaceae bacterium]|nr:alpha-1,2-fucosyltransferase [Bacteroidaceae bacterium]
LWTYVATLSECIVKKKKMVILFFDYTIEEFPHLLHSKYICFPFYQPWYLNRGNGWNNFKGGTWKLTHSERWDKVFRFFGFIKGWHTRRDTRYIAEAKKELQQIFTPKESIVNAANNMIAELKKDSDIVIGVHIRRGDYKDWNDGRFYYSFEEYHQFMQRVASLFPDKRVSFFISSNEKLSKEMFPNVLCSYHTGENASVISDLYTLSLCDYIIGPFSTFSRWASFIGEKPICYLEDRNQRFTLDSFSKMVDYFHQEDGRELEDW